MFGSIFFKRKMFFVQEGKMIWKSSKSRQRWIFAGFIFELLAGLILTIISGEKIISALLLSFSNIVGAVTPGAMADKGILFFFAVLFVTWTMMDGYYLWNAHQSVEINTERKTIYIIRPKKTKKYSIDDKFTIDVLKSRTKETCVRIVYGKEDGVLKLTPKDPGFRELIDFFEEHFPQRITNGRYRGFPLS